MCILIFILIAAAVVFFVRYKSAKQKEEAEAEQKRIQYEKKRKAQEDAKRKNLETLTEAEKKVLSSLENDLLSKTLSIYEMALKGNADAMVIIGITYQSKLKNATKAFYWMQKAANLGNSEGKYWLGEFYVSGYGVKEDRIKGVSMIIDAAAMGNKTAIQSLKENGKTVAEMRSCGIPV